MAGVVNARVNQHLSSGYDVVAVHPDIIPCREERTVTLQTIPIVSLYTCKASKRTSDAAT